MKTHKRILKEAQIVLKALLHARDDDGNRLNICNLEIYLTDADTGQVLEPVSYTHLTLPTTPYV